MRKKKNNKLMKINSYKKILFKEMVQNKINNFMRKNLMVFIFWKKASVPL